MLLLINNILIKLFKGLRAASLKCVSQDIQWFWLWIFFEMADLIDIDDPAFLDGSIIDVAFDSIETI